MYYLFIMRQVICWFVYIGKNPRFTAFLDSNLHTRLAIVTENEGLAFPPRNLPKKIRPDPSTFYLVIVVTNRQTNDGDYIIPRESFCGDNKNNKRTLVLWLNEVHWLINCFLCAHPIELATSDSNYCGIYDFYLHLQPKVWNNVYLVFSL